VLTNALKEVILRSWSLERALHLGLFGEPSQVTSCETKVTSRGIKLLIVTQSYFPRHKVTSLYVLVSVEGSNFVPQDLGELSIYD
jgi:hypothetical protein